ncbi:MAG: glycine--tRNA ligase [Candidatus Bathyarchaeota archaeon]|nr:MAG: glycine--tRNA ligase [Candidatus Bathyarchaeota archaeon]
MKLLENQLDSSFNPLGNQQIKQERFIIISTVMIRAITYEWTGRYMQTHDKYERISEIAKRRGFFWPSYEIYGGVSGFMTLGPLGSILKRKIEDEFRSFFIRPLGLYEIETSVIMPGKVFEASGHVSHFKEPMIECRKCKRRFRADHLLQEFAKMSDTETEKMNLSELSQEIKTRKVTCPECSSDLGESKQFLTMFTTTIGPYSESIGYGRPEAAQGIFVEFRRLNECARGRLPFGVVQIGHALRNEISPRQGPIRLREFTIIDVEFFFDPENAHCKPLKGLENETLRLILAENKLKGKEEPVEATVKEALEKGFVKAEWQAFFMVRSKHFLMKLGVSEDKQRFIEKLEWERAHYSVQGFDQEILLDRWGWVEVSGHNYRTDYDLKQHMRFSGVDMRVFKEHDRRAEREEIFISPIMSRIGPTFKDSASQVVELISSVNPIALQARFKEDGFFMAGRFKILPEHVQVKRRGIEERGKHFIPHVVEPSFGSDRMVYIALEYAYRTKENRTVLSLPRKLAPNEIGVFPLVSKDGLPEKAKQVHEMLINEHFNAEYDESGSIGRRYARADEVGTPLQITIDYQTLLDDTVTIRDRDSWKQVRGRIEDLPASFKAFFRHEIEFESLGSRP